MSLNTPSMSELKAIVEWVQLTEDVRELSLKVGEVEVFISKNHAPGRGISVAPAEVPHPVAQAPTAVASLDSADSPQTSPNAPAASPDAVENEGSQSPGAHPSELAPGEVAVTSPMVGTFYVAPQPGAPAFVSVGDRVEPDSVLGIVEVMKLMNNIEAGVSGTVARILVTNEQAVEFGQPLIVIQPRTEEK